MQFTILITVIHWLLCYCTSLLFSTFILLCNHRCLLSPERLSSCRTETLSPLNTNFPLLSPYPLVPTILHSILESYNIGCIFLDVVFWNSLRLKTAKQCNEFCRAFTQFSKVSQWYDNHHTVSKIRGWIMGQ